MAGRPPSTNRETLFEAAIGCFADAGFRNTSHADVAAAAGIGRTTFYEYFASTEDLLVQLVEARVPELVSELIEAVPAELAPDRRLRALMVRMIEFVGTDHIGLILHTEVARLSDEAQARIGAAHVDLSRAFADVYRRGVAAGLFKELPGRLASRLIYEVIMTAGRELMDRPEPKQYVHELADTTADFVLAGLRMR